jgi:hypothetical protein
MSGNNKTQQTQDAFTICQDHADKIFSGVRTSVPQYHQSVTNLQQEFLTACENTVRTCINTNKENAAKFGIKTQVSDSIAKSGNGIAKDIASVIEIQNKLLLFGIDTAQQGIKTIQDNAKMYNGFVQTWLSYFKKD